MWDLVPSAGIRLESPALEEWSLSCWATKEYYRALSRVVNTVVLKFLFISIV